MQNTSTLPAHRYSRRGFSDGAGNMNPNAFICNMDHCEVRIADGVGIFLCERHLQKAWAAYQVHMGAEIPAERPDPEVDINALDTSGVVYVVRVKDLIKIGWTTAPENRFRQLEADAVLHQSRGTRKDEYKLQARFIDHLAKGREWFECNAETLRLVENLRAGRLAA